MDVITGYLVKLGTMVAIGLGLFSIWGGLEYGFVEIFFLHILAIIPSSICFHLLKNKTEFLVVILFLTTPVIMLWLIMFVDDAYFPNSSLGIGFGHLVMYATFISGGILLAISLLILTRKFLVYIYQSLFNRNI